MSIYQQKERELDTVFKDCDFEQKAMQKASNLVLMALQDDKKCVDTWNAFGKVSWNKSF